MKGQSRHFFELIVALAIVPVAACQSQSKQQTTNMERPHEAVGQGSDFVDDREAMIETQLKNRDITNPSVLHAMQTVPRHQFVPDQFKEIAYRDGALPIGHDQTISQPYIVATMTQALQPHPEDRVLEVGTGSGYQAAILAEIVDDVYTIEIVEELASEAKAKLENLGYENITVKHGDGYKGWPQHAPFDKIIVTAAPPELPEALVEQLKPGGRMVVPVGEQSQTLKIIEKNANGDISKERLMNVRFVPMVREADDE